ncbi:MAG: RrF2 family transcriptional regulator [Clostridia bacterium]|nr:RrF2 family transcriptional regulator [Clostridia bacterium]
MKVSTKGRYGLNIVLDIANSKGAPVRIAEIAARQGIPFKYAEQIAGTLTRRGLLKSVRGAQGGYLLNKPTEEYTVGEIVRCLEGDVLPVGCVGDAHVCERTNCTARDVWMGLHRVINAYLDGITLHDLITQGE